MEIGIGGTGINKVGTYNFETGKLLDQILDLSYDPSWMGGALSIKADQLISNENVMYIAIGGVGISKPGTYNLTSYMNVYYSDSKNECSYDKNSTVSGFITITLPSPSLPTPFISKWQ